MNAPLAAPILFRVGDTWVGPEWAVIVDGAAVDLTVGWVVRAHARRRPTDDVVLMEWSTELGRVRLGSATVTRGDRSTVTTSTVRLHHTAAAAAVLAPFSGHYDCEISNGAVTHTITAGTVQAVRDVTRGAA